MRPLRRSSMCGTTCWQQWYAPFRHESITASHSLSGSLCTRQPMQCGIVHQYVDLTKALQHLCDHALHICRDCHIGLHW